MMRKSVFGRKKKLKETGVTIKEDVTTTRQQIYKMACDAFPFKNVWSNDGAIFLKNSGKITKFEDIKSLHSYINNLK